MQIWSSGQRFDLETQIWEILIISKCMIPEDIEKDRGQEDRQTDKEQPEVEEKTGKCE